MPIEIHQTPRCGHQHIHAINQALLLCLFIDATKHSKAL
ncbi:Uncharacterised protein [Vibrio cholerae]|nr:Uncharacterised protein [Vibrio cholerae]